MSLSDYIGSTGTPAVIAGATLAVFEFVDRASSTNAKASLAAHIKSFDPDTVTSLPRGANELFQTIFGSDHFSRKCFFRSACISIAGIVFFLAITIATQSEDSYFYWDIISLRQGWNEPFMIGPEQWFRMAALWVPFSILIDYLMLFKTRFVLNLLSKRRFSKGAMALLCLLDLVSGYYFFFVVLGYFQQILHFGDFSFLDVFDEIGYYTYGFRNVLWPINSVSAFFYAGLLPSVWLWLYIGSVFIAGAIVHSKSTLGWLKWFLDVGGAPFRSVGIVAAGVTFIATLIAVLLDQML